MQQAHDHSLADQPRLIVPALGYLYRRLWPFTEPMIRVFAGISLMFHGYPKLFTETAINVAFFQQAGFRPALFWTILVGLTEFVGGLCLVLGLFTRAVVLPILLFLLVAVTYHSQFGFNWVIRGFEYPLFWAIVMFHFLVRGGGRWSVDHWIGHHF